MIRTNSSLVQVATEDKLLLQGYLTESDKNKPALLHIHGYSGNFYENYFVHVIDKHIKAAGLTFLTGNTRGVGFKTAFNMLGKEEEIIIGARWELLEDAYKDIDAWIKLLLDKGYKEIILQGHSLGTMKIIRYLFEGTYRDKVKKLILLSPFDKKAMLYAYTKTPLEELIKRAEKMIEDGKGDDEITKEFEIIDVSYKTWLSWYRQDDLGRVFEFCNGKYDFPILGKITIPVKMIVGSKDEYFHPSNPESPQEAANILKEHIKICETIIIKGAPHSYKGFEDNLAEEILKFIH